MSRTYLSLHGLRIRYVRLLTIGWFELALTWLDPGAANSQASADE